MAIRDVQVVEWALRERVKELTCLYGIARVMQQPGATLDSCITEILELLPPAWQFSDRTCARIVLDAREFRTKMYSSPTCCQKADLVVNGAKRGCVEVGYLGKFETENPFLEEEASLIEMVAREVSIMVERHESEEKKQKLQEQLRHADRLATIGQLAAGVAHELNEPLANILGFAQLAKKEPQLPEQTGKDMEKIVRNCLHAREIIHKLLTFARQMPPEKTRINLNQVISDGLYLLESRCLKSGIEVVRVLDPEIPEIFGDASQLNQVLVNFVVNAVQAMRDGGIVTIETKRGLRDKSALLIVADTGSGMTKAVRANIFTPFFTTKDVNEGTGLGLAVVHGIIASHGGTIRVQSEPGKGSRFEVELPVDGEESG